MTVVIHPSLPPFPSPLPPRPQSRRGDDPASQLVASSQSLAFRAAGLACIVPFCHSAIQSCSIPCLLVVFSLSLTLTYLLTLSFSLILSPSSCSIIFVLYFVPYHPVLFLLATLRSPRHFRLVSSSRIGSVCDQLLFFRPILSLFSAIATSRPCLLLPAVVFTDQHCSSILISY